MFLLHNNIDVYNIELDNIAIYIRTSGINIIIIMSIIINIDKGVNLLFFSTFSGI